MFLFTPLWLVVPYRQVITCANSSSALLVVYTGADCGLWNASNDMGCYWNATVQSFEGPRCVAPPQVDCACRHLTDFSGGAAPKIVTASVAQLLSLSGADIFTKLRVLAALVFSLFGCMHAVCALVWAAGDHQARLGALQTIFSSQLHFAETASGAWVWQLQRAPALTPWVRCYRPLSSIRLVLRNTRPLRGRCGGAQGGKADSPVAHVKGPLVVLAGVLGLPVVRLRAAVPEHLLGGLSLAEALGRLRGISAAAQGAAQEAEEEAQLFMLLGRAGATSAIASGRLSKAGDARTLARSSTSRGAAASGTATMRWTDRGSAPPARTAGSAYTPSSTPQLPARERIGRLSSSGDARGGEEAPAAAAPESVKVALQPVHSPGRGKRAAELAFAATQEAGSFTEASEQTLVSTALVRAVPRSGAGKRRRVEQPIRPHTRRCSLCCTMARASQCWRSRCGSSSVRATSRASTWAVVASTTWWRCSRRC